MYFLNAFLVMCGMACGLPLLFISNWLCRKYVPSDSRTDNANEASLELMRERNDIDLQKRDALNNLAEIFLRQKGGGTP